MWINCGGGRGGAEDAFGAFLPFSSSFGDDRRLSATVHQWQPTGRLAWLPTPDSGRKTQAMQPHRSLRLLQHLRHWTLPLLQ
jgi:hypothetical protein